MTAEFEITRDVITKSLRQGWSLPWREVTVQLLDELNKRPTVDACIIAALETKLEETERELRLAIERALAAEARLATAHDALHDCGFLGGTRP